MKFIGIQVKTTNENGQPLQNAQNTNLPKWKFGLV